MRVIKMLNFIAGDKSSSLSTTEKHKRIENRDAGYSK